MMQCHDDFIRCTTIVLGEFNDTACTCTCAKWSTVYCTLIHGVAYRGLAKWRGFVHQIDRTPEPFSARIRREELVDYGMRVSLSVCVSEVVAIQFIGYLP